MICHNTETGWHGDDFVGWGPAPSSGLDSEAGKAAGSVYAHTVGRPWRVATNSLAWGSGWDD